MAQYDIDESRIARQRAIAKSLRESGNVSFDPAASAGRLVYARSPWEDIAGVLNTGFANYKEGKADRLAEALAKRKQSDAQAGVESSLDALVGASQKGMPQTADNPMPADPWMPKSPEQLMTPQDQRLGPSMHVPVGTTAPFPGLTEKNTKREKLANVLRGIDPEQAAGVLQNEVLKRELAGPEKLMNLPDGRVYDPNTRQIIVDKVPAAPPAPKEHKVEPINVVGADGKRKTIDQSEWKGELLWKDPVAAPSGGTGAGGKIELFPPDTLDGIVDEVMADPAAMWKHTSRAQAEAPRRFQIDNALTAKLKDIGMTRHDLIRSRALANSERKNMDALIKSQSLVEAFDTVARGNGERVLDLVKGVDVTGVPALEGLIRAGKVKAGSTDAAEFASVLTAYQREVARILAGSPNLTGVVTDTANAKMEDMVSGSLSAPQLARIIPRLQFEMDLRRHGFDEQIAQAQNAIAVGSTPKAMPAAPVAPSAAPAAPQSDDNVFSAAEWAQLTPEQQARAKALGAVVK